MDAEERTALSKCYVCPFTVEVVRKKENAWSTGEQTGSLKKRLPYEKIAEYLPVVSIFLNHNIKICHLD